MVLHALSASKSADVTHIMVFWEACHLCRRGFVRLASKCLYLIRVKYVRGIHSNFYGTTCPQCFKVTYRENGGQKDYAVFGHCVIQCP